MKDKLRVLFLPIGVEGVVYYRIKSFCQEMNKLDGVSALLYTKLTSRGDHGLWEFEFKNNPKVREEICRYIGQADITILQYVHVQEVLSLFALKEQFGKKILFEADDFTFDVPNFNPAFRSGSYKPDSEFCKIQKYQIHESTAGIVSTHYLKNELLKYNSNIHVIPNSIDFNVWDKLDKPKKRSSKIRIGWIGGANHDDDLRIMIPVSQAITKKYKNVEFLYVYGVSGELKKAENKQIKILHKYVKTSQYPQHVASQGFDIGVAPLVDNVFNRCKSNLKWLEYSALSIPTVASNIEPYKRSIVDGKTGLLASNSVEDWVNKISLLVDNEKLRKDMGIEANKEIRKHYNLKSNTQLYLSILQRVVRNG